jgi:chromosome segregation ATPase
MNDGKALFDYWHKRVQLTNHELISSPHHIQTQQLRHECTNYDDLRSRREVQLLDEPERSKVVAIIKYECTAKVLQHRAGCLRDRVSQLADSHNELEQQRSKLLKLIKVLQEKLFGKDKHIKKLESRIIVLEAENEALQADLENNKAEAELQAELEQLQKKYDVVEKRRRELAKNNQSLGGRVAHTKRYKQQRDDAIAEVKALKEQLESQITENQQLREENQHLQAEIEKLQKMHKLGIVEIRKS